MRTTTARLGGLLGMCLGLCALMHAGCSNFYEEVYVPLTDPALATTGTAGAGGGTTTSTIEPSCIPRGNSEPVRPDCGVFVSLSMGSDDNDGGMGAPYATITKAIAAAQGEPIYVCAETFAEAVNLTSGVKIFGGLDCANAWKHVGDTKKTEIAPAAGSVPLVLATSVKATLVDVVLRAADATEAGGSSTGVIASTEAELTLVYADVVAGKGKDGAEGQAFSMSASAGAAGNPGADACSGDVVVGGKSVTNACDGADVNDDSISGSGGIGQDSSGGPGGPGLPDGAMNGGAGEGASACTAGTVGDDGAPGASVPGATGIGTISAQGYTGVAGLDGMKGNPGQGGGGGGGAKGGSGVPGSGKCETAASAGGASGGSGGSGGCGGAGGKGGQAGGGSIGIVAIGAKLVFDNVKITTSAGGVGGNGGAGQAGGLGGAGAAGGTKGAATALKDACAGGNGGSGGNGGLGGGGLGGPSIGIAYLLDTPNTKGATIVIGTPGDGGSGDGDKGTGAKGVAAETQAF